METFKGKMMVRKSKLPNGEDVVVLCGVFKSSELPENFNDNDEMWSVELGVLDVIKMYRPNSTVSNYSPEDFLRNADNIQHPMAWRRKDMTEKEYRDKYGY